MKHFIKVWSIVLLITATVPSYSQSKKSSGHTATKKEALKKYVCPNCSLVFDAAGSCTYCQMKTCAVGDLYCVHCGTSPSDSGKCVYCTNKMLIMQLPDPKYKIVRDKK